MPGLERGGFLGEKLEWKGGFGECFWWNYVKYFP